jgi:membrane protein CcdC involved in cytochrome C biogenesis
MSLDQGLWSDYSVIVSSVVALLISMATILALQKYSDHRLSPRQALLLPFTAGIGEVLVLEAAGQEAWFWLFVGSAVAVGAS